MTEKKSGLADSPFFRPPVPPNPPPVQMQDGSVPVFSIVPPTDQIVEHLNERTPERLNSRTNERLNTRTVVQPNERTDERLNNGTPEHSNNRTVERPTRTISRKSYDIFDDQAQTLDELALQWSKERKKYITKGQVVRELLDEIIHTHTKQK